MQLKIGELARLAQVSVQTLRYYDSINLLKPELVDQFTNYRYYDLGQLSQINAILAYKDLGFSLEQITVFIHQKPSVSDLRTLLELRKQELKGEIDAQLERLERIETRLSMFESGQGFSSAEIVIKKLPSVKVVSLRAKIPSYWDVTPIWEQLYSGIAEEKWQICEPYLTLFHSADPEIEVEVCAPAVSALKVAESPLSVTELPEYECAACYVHKGSFHGLGSAYTQLIKWIDLNNYMIIGPDREVYLQLPNHCQFENDPEAVTELQVPIQRKIVL